MATFSDLSPELILMIFSHVSPRSLYQFASINKFTYELSASLRTKHNAMCKKYKMIDNRRSSFSRLFAAMVHNSCTRDYVRTVDIKDDFHITGFANDWKDEDKNEQEENRCEAFHGGPRQVLGAQFYQNARIALGRWGYFSGEQDDESDSRWEGDLRFAEDGWQAFPHGDGSRPSAWLALLLPQLPNLQSIIISGLLWEYKTWPFDTWACYPNSMPSNAFECLTSIQFRIDFWTIESLNSVVSLMKLPSLTHLTGNRSGFDEKCDNSTDCYQHNRKNLLYNINKRPASEKSSPRNPRVTKSIGAPIQVLELVPEFVSPQSLGDILNAAQPQSLEKFKYSPKFSTNQDWGNPPYNIRHYIQSLLKNAGSSLRYLNLSIPTIYMDTAYDYSAGPVGFSQFEALTHLQVNAAVFGNGHAVAEEAQSYTRIPSSPHNAIRPRVDDLTPGDQQIADMLPRTLQVLTIAYSGDEEQSVLLPKLARLLQNHSELPKNLRKLSLLGTTLRNEAEIKRVLGPLCTRRGIELLSRCVLL